MPSRRSSRRRTRGPDRLGFGEAGTRERHCGWIGIASQSPRLVRLLGGARPRSPRRNSGLVLDFYNESRKAVREARPTAAHLALVGLERAYDVRIVTQNVDDLHERVGSSSVLHLHGEVRKARSTQDPTLVTHSGDGDIQLGDRWSIGSELQPNIFRFGVSVPAMEETAE